MTAVNILKEVEVLELALKCPSCKNTLDDPHVVGKCCHTICKKCFLGKFSMMCPVCNIPVNTKDSQEDTQLKCLLVLHKELKELLENESEITYNTLDHKAKKQQISSTETIILPLPVHFQKKSDNCSSASKVTKHRSSDFSPNISQPCSSNAGKSIILETPDLRRSRQFFSTPQNKTNFSASTTLQSSTKKASYSVKRLNSSVRSSPTTLEKRNAKGETPLHVAVIKGDKEKVLELLGQGAIPNVKDHSGWTPLHEASNHGYVKIASMLLDHGALVNVPGDENITPLHDAVMNRKMDLAKMLASRGADVHARTCLGNTSLDLCQNDEERKSLTDVCPHHISPSIVPPPLQAAEMNKIVFLPTSLSDSQKFVLQKCAEMLEADVVEEYTKDVTHVIVACDNWGRCTRTLKFLMGILGGKWIINFQWVEVCMEYKQKVEEEMFEVAGIKNQPESDAPRCARENIFQQLPPLFDGCFFYLYGHFTKPTPEREQLCDLIHLGGGKILTREPRPDTVQTDQYQIPYHAAGTPLEDFNHFVLYQEKPPRDIDIRSNHICTVQVLWLVECITVFKLLDPSEVTPSK